MADELADLDDTAVAVVVVIAIIIFTIIQLLFLITLISLFIWLVVKQSKLKQERQRLQSQIEPIEKSSFIKRLLFIALSIPLPILVIIVEVLTIFASVTVAIKATTVSVVFLNLFAFGTYLSSTYLSFLLLYVAFMLASAVHSLKRSSVLEYRIQLALLVISLLIYIGASVCSATVGSVSLSINKYPEVYDRSTINAVFAGVLGTTGPTFWVGYFISVLVLGIGLRFYFLVISYSKKTSNQILIFLSVLIIASVVQAMGNLLSQFSIFSNIFLLLFFLLQRSSEAIFLFSLVLLFIPLQQLANGTKQITTKVVQTAEKIADGMITINKKKFGTFGSETQMLEAANSSVSTPVTPSTPTTPTPLLAPQQEFVSIAQ